MSATLQAVSGARPRRGPRGRDASTSWNVEVGDEVELNQTLCSVETGKAEVEIPSPYAGRIVELRRRRGRRAAGRLGAGAHRHRSRHRRAEPQGRNPVLVGYGTDEAMDTSRRPAGSRPRAAPPSASSPRICTSIWQRCSPVRARRRDHSRGRARAADGIVRTRSVGCSGVRARNGRANGVVAQPDSRCPCQRSRSTARDCCSCASGSRRSAPSVTPFVLTLRLLRSR